MSPTLPSANQAVPDSAPAFSFALRHSREMVAYRLPTGCGQLTPIGHV